MERLVEREEHLEQLLAAVEGPDGRVVFISGEAGSGKTALIRAFRERLDHRYDFRLGRCEPLSTPTPLGPLYDMLPTLSDQVARRLYEGDDRAALFADVMREIGSTSTVTVFEDTHYADEATLDLIRYLGRRIRQTPAVLVCAFRPGEIDRTHPLRALAGELGDALVRIGLGPLSVAGVRALAEGADIDPLRIYTATGGNPLFVTQLLAHPGEELPASISDAVLALARSLPDEAWELLDTLALAPDGLTLQAVDELGVGAEIDRAAAMGLVEVDGNRVRCRHDLIRAALDAHVPAAARLRIHRRILDVLARGPGTDVSVLAHHAVEAGSASEALAYSLEAATRAARDGSHREAASHYANALRFEAHMDPGQRLATRKSYSYELYLTGALEAAFDEASAVYNLAHDDIERGRALRWMSRLSWFLGKRADAVRYGQMAVDVFERDDTDLHELAYAYSNLAQLAMLDDNVEEVERWGQRALEIARAEGDLEVVAHALNNLGTSGIKRGLESRVALEESLTISLDQGFGEHAARAFTNLSYNLLWQRQIDEASDMLERGLAFCEEADLETWWWYMRGPLARMLVDQCEWDQASEVIRTILETQTAPIMRHDALVAQARERLRRGAEGAEEAVSAAIDVGRSIGEYSRLVLGASVAVEAVAYGVKSGNEAFWADVFAEAVNRGDRWAATEIAFWMVRNGADLPARDVAEPLALELRGDVDGASRRWTEAGSVVHAAIVDAWSGEPDRIRRAFDALTDAGADGTIRALRTALRARGVERLPRGPISRTRRNPAGLTARQLEVLDGLASGMTNAEIAEQLFISPKTVEHHVAAITTKLGARTRGEAVARARAEGIIG